MKKAIAVSNILSWINLVIGGAFTLFSLLAIFAFPIVAVLFLVVLMGSIILHSYAALQLRKSLLNSSVPLNKQTPVGIRIMGYMVMLVGFILFTDAVFIFQHTKEAIKQVTIPTQITEADFIKMTHGIGVFLLIFSVSLVLNVILNLRFLKWYVLSSQKES